MSMTSRIGAATPIAIATMNSTPANHSSDPGLPLIPLKPDSPVRRSWSQMRNPNASAR